MPIRILVADDNALVRSALRQVLELEGQGHWEVLEASNGLDAVLWAREQKPDLVILDLAMPLLDGFRVAREIGKALPAIPILMHTLYWSPRVELEAMKVGVRKAIPKSDSSSLVSVVREMLAPVEQQREQLISNQVPSSLPEVEVSDQEGDERTSRDSSTRQGQADLKKKQGGFETLAS